ncbi:4-hydroxy-tetrahydrodipicolinate reductase [Anaerosporomusa subterranea]|jgi:4-hydroxy-tetrahydrodipicolinate reductase|uniref:4-hydroxy-tetrahydrodipicolinate reductase n=1 Tax=Anaerosporomusa subterranea TaxID=1794912 RepID=A0A154BVE9_ANASB|nr:4-hydroxy-tetrahydrodipicolinate reductase [Anaerosporomusa subterranea]KYZ77790.1 4-hydroxy-tetrahydrodipicolinate reductase [Anaerosporomusa subterranea]MDF2500937.1 dapB 3 [Anaerosporomusa subterranea]
MKVALIGLGTTGKIVSEYLFNKNVLSMVLCRENSHNAGMDLGEVLHRPYMGITIETTANLEEKLNIYKPDILIDFSSPKFLRDHLSTLAKCKVNVVTAVSDYSQMDIKRIKVLARKGEIGVAIAPNITLGVNVLLKMAQIAAGLLSDYDFQVIDENHKNKKDSPSGTAEKIASAIKKVFEKSGEHNDLVPIHSIRAGDITGRHKVLVCGKYDQIEITHTAFSRTAYAEGAYRAACFIYGRKGVYEMKDVYGLMGNSYTGEQIPLSSNKKGTASVYA